MKKAIITLAIAMVTITSVFAQFEKGRMLMGGSAGFSSQKEEWKQGSNSLKYGKNTTIYFAPQLGYFIINNLAAGVTLEITSTAYKPDDPDFEVEHKSFSTQVQPFVRYYLPAHVFIQGNFGFGSTKSRDTYMGDTETGKTKVSGWALGLGYAILLNDHVAIEPVFGYSANQEKNEDFDPVFITTYSGLFLHIGVQVYLGGSK